MTVVFQRKRAPFHEESRQVPGPFRLTVRVLGLGFGVWGLGFRESAPSSVARHKKDNTSVCTRSCCKTHDLVVRHTKGNKTPCKTHKSKTLSSYNS